MKNLFCNTDKVPSERDCLSINKAIKLCQTVSNTDCWLKEIEKINQCPQRKDSLENQLKDLCLAGEKLGLVYASHFIKNYYNLKF
ncbi:hypothetical protein FIA58_014025 [Flavobacterium jejuense]|uniref:Uncharacterized protein n=1 Tax=Flavobacterium jejuense TaxID=1544455 RepID=A0ABX0IYH5_9FLAO|nr:hypothetical protein [Flavobacterium jejuense]NHN26799.1 hypothetical protein [Flavobacterium jejuense]